MVQLTELVANATYRPNTARGGLNIEFSGEDLTASPIWQLGGFTVRFLYLPPGETIELDPAAGSVCVKVITGSLETRSAFPGVGEVRSTRMRGGHIVSPGGALVCLIGEIDTAPAKITEMSQLEASGPGSERLQWQTFDEKFGAVTDIFEGLDAHMIPGFHLLDGKGQEIAYVHFWTAGKGVDVSTHNHGHAPSEHAPAFAETHLVLRNGTGLGAMYECAAPDATERTRLVVGEGEEHGPFFRFDPATGAPVLRDNGAVEYPWHGWQGGTDDEPEQAFDLVTAFEISPAYARVPSDC